jgi:hypothetical protein
MTQIFYACDSEYPAVMTLEILFANFTSSDAWKGLSADQETIRDEVTERGWFKGTHEGGGFIVVNMDKYQNTIAPAADEWDRFYKMQNQLRESFADVLAELAAADGAILYWQTDKRRYKPALDAGAIKEDGELLVHPDAICVEPGMAYVMPDKKA